jgi:hypothetical protein
MRSTIEVDEGNDVFRSRTAVTRSSRPGTTVNVNVKSSEVKSGTLQSISLRDGPGVVKASDVWRRIWVVDQARENDCMYTVAVTKEQQDYPEANEI